MPTTGNTCCRERVCGGFCLNACLHVLWGAPLGVFETTGLYHSCAYVQAFESLSITITEVDAIMLVRTYQVVHLVLVNLGDAWVAQALERPTLDFGSCHDPTVCECEPHVGPHADTAHNLLRILSPSPSAPLPLVRARSLARFKKILIS